MRFVIEAAIAGKGGTAKMGIGGFGDTEKERWTESLKRSALELLDC